MKTLQGNVVLKFLFFFCFFLPIGCYLLWIPVKMELLLGNGGAGRVRGEAEGTFVRDVSANWYRKVRSAA